MDRSFYTLYPNLFIILVSDSGVGAKSTAIKIPVSAASGQILVKAIPDINIMRGKLTPGYLVDWMCQAATKHPNGDAELTILASEFKVFSSGAYESSLVKDLTDLFDNGAFEYRTKNAGVYKVDRPCINLLAASTPEWLTTGRASDFIGGGFSSRIIPVAITSEEKPPSWPEKPPSSIDIESKLVADLGEIGQLSGPFFVTTEAKQFIVKWAKIRHKYQSEDQRLKGYYSKKEDMVLKLSMILSASLSSDMVVTEQHMEMGIALLAKLEQTMSFAYQGVAWGEQAKYQDKVLQTIKDAGAIDHSKLLRKYHHCMTGKDLKEIITTLIDEDEILYCIDKVGGKTKVAYSYKGVTQKGRVDP
jgi:hypothetical protein